MDMTSWEYSIYVYMRLVNNVIINKKYTKSKNYPFLWCTNDLLLLLLAFLGLIFNLFSIITLLVIVSGVVNDNLERNLLSSVNVNLVN